MRILKDIIAVIKIDELMMNRLAKDRPDDCGEKTANPEDHPAVVPASAFPRDDLGLRFCLHSISGGHGIMRARRQRSKFFALDAQGQLHAAAEPVRLAKRREYYCSDSSPR